MGFGRIKNDDKLIQAEGVDSLSEAELRQACRDRGMLELPSVEEMRLKVLALTSYPLFSPAKKRMWIFSLGDCD